MNWMNDDARGLLVLDISCMRPSGIWRLGPEALEDGMRHLSRSHFAVYLMVCVPLLCSRSLAMA